MKQGFVSSPCISGSLHVQFDRYFFTTAYVPKFKYQSMISHLSVILVLFLALSDALESGVTGPHVGDHGFWREENSTEKFHPVLLNSSHQTNTFTSGFLRTDTFEVPHEKWVRAQVLPVGVCIEKGSHGRSTMISQIIKHSTSIVQITNVYKEVHCSGEYSSIALELPIMERSAGFEHFTHHIEDNTSVLPPYSESIVIT